MPVAFNPETNEALFLGDDGSWHPSKVAAHQDTGETVAFDGSGWVPFKKPEKPAPAGRTLAETWENPTFGSLVGVAKGIYDLGVNAKKAFEGGYAPKPEVPGQLTERDIQNRGEAWQNMRKDANFGSLSVMGGAIPLGGALAPKGALTMGGARPGHITGEPVAPPSMPGAGSAIPPAAAGIVDKATALNIPIPRYMVDEARGTQGLAAGLQNIPFAGDKIAAAANQTQKAIGAAANNVREGFGTGSPAVGGGFAKDALTDWIGTGSKEVADKLYGAVDKLVDPSVVREIANTRAIAQRIAKENQAAGLPPGKAVQFVEEAASRHRYAGQEATGLTYPAVQRLRSQLGEMVSNRIIPEGMSHGDVKRIYEALTNDLSYTIKRAGGAPAVASWEKANSIYASIAERRQSLTKIVGIKGDAAPEAVLARLHAMAGSKSTADTTRLLQARKAMGPEAWNEVASSVISRIGRDAAGEFSVDRFLGPNGYNGLSPAGRSILFKSTGRDNLGKSLDDIAAISSHVQDKLKQFANPSGTAKSLSATGAVLQIVHSPIAALKTLTSIIGGNKMAGVLSEPATARSMAEWTNAYRDAIISPSANSSRRVQRAAQGLANIMAPRVGYDSTVLAGILRGEIGAAATDLRPQPEPPLQ